MKNYVFTQTGYLDLDKPEDYDFPMREIADALSRVQRWAAQGDYPFTVAQHSIMCADVAHNLGLSVQVQRECLMHDAAEAYIGDLARPIKMHDPYFEALDLRVTKALFRRHRIAFPLCEAVHDIDRYVALFEAAICFGPRAFDDCFSDVKDLGLIVTIPPSDAGAFLRVAQRLDLY